MMDSNKLPSVNHIFQGEVMCVKPFGAFVKIPGHRRNGLVHITQLSQSRVDEVSDIAKVGDSVWCKVISVDEEANKIGLSMKVVQQGTGKDLDPGGVQISQDDKKRKNFFTRVPEKITLDAVLKTNCRKCGTSGHLSQDCFQRPGGKVYDLVDDDDDKSDRHDTGDNSANSDAKKGKKVKKQHKHKRVHRDSRGGQDSDDSDSSPKEKKSHHRHPKRTRKERSSSDDDVSSNADNNDDGAADSDKDGAGGPPPKHVSKKHGVGAGGGGGGGGGGNVSIGKKEKAKMK